MIDIGIKAPDRERAEAFLVAAGLAVPKTSPPRWKDGVAICDGIFIVVKPAVYDEKDELVSAAEIDPAYHANIRLFGPDADKLATTIEKGGSVGAGLMLAKASDEVSAKTKPIRVREVSGLTLFRFGGADGVKTPACVWF